MKITKLIIKNYKNIKDTEINFNDFTIFIGKNNVGKSNLLNVLDLFFNWIESHEYKENNGGGGSGNRFNHTNYLKDYRMFLNHKPTTIELVGEFILDKEELNQLFPDIEIRLPEARAILREDLGTKVTVCKKIIVAENKEATWKIEYITMNLVSLYDHKSNKSLGRNSNGVYNLNSGDNLAEKFLMFISKSFTKIPAVRNISSEGRNAVRAEPDGKYMPGEFFRYEKERPAGKKLLFKEIRSNLLEIFPEFKVIESNTEDGESKVNIYFDDFPSSCVGTGINQVFVIIFTLCSNQNKIFAIEEPEIHLHPDMQRRLFDFLKKQSQEKQIVIATHSTIFSSFSEFMNLYLLNKEENKTLKPVLVNELENLDSIRYELGSKNSDLFFYDIVVLIEGDTEEMAFPIIAKAMLYDLNDLGIKIINIKGSDKLSRIHDFLKYIKDSYVTPFVIIDKKKDVEARIIEFTKEGILDKNNYHIWTKGDFEDCFDWDEIFKAMQNICGADFKLDHKSFLQIKGTSNKSTSKVLDDYLNEKNLGDLNKPELGAELAILLKDKIKSNEDERSKTEIEVVINKIVKLL